MTWPADPTPTRWFTGESAGFDATSDPPLAPTDADVWGLVEGTAGSVGAVVGGAVIGTFGTEVVGALVTAAVGNVVARAARTAASPPPPPHALTTSAMTNKPK